MAATLQTQAIQIANGLMSIAQQLASIKGSIDMLATQYTQLTLSGVFNAMHTAPVNADGSLGTADLSPVLTNPIDTRVAAQSTLTRTILATDLASLNTLVQAVSTLLAGSAVSQQGQSPQLLAKLVGG
jgi:hypothetical protein